jgi:hypothetical protein
MTLQYFFYIKVVVTTGFEKGSIKSGNIFRAFIWVVQRPRKNEKTSVLGDAELRLLSHSFTKEHRHCKFSILLS